MGSVFIFGAGASASYSESPTGVRPPLASGFFNAYKQLPLSEDLHVAVGNLINHVRDTYGISWEFFDTFDQDIESFMTHLDLQLRQLAARRLMGMPDPDNDGYARFFQANRAYDQTILLIAHILNEIQNGPPSSAYTDFLRSRRTDDTLITFNWDTLLDRALLKAGQWTVDTGYGVEFESVLADTWRDPVDYPSDLRLLKLHGSTNWLVNYVSRSLDDGQRHMVTRAQPTSDRDRVALGYDYGIEHGEAVLRVTSRRVDWGRIDIPSPGEPDAFPVCIESTGLPVATYKSRYRAGYAPLSYFFPPDHPRTGVPLMPLVVPPTSFKLYDEFAHVLDPLWDDAASALAGADSVFLIGYSLPDTDTRSVELLRSVTKSHTARITIVNPDPDPIADRLVRTVGIEAGRVHRQSMTFQDFVSRGTRT